MKKNLFLVLATLLLITATVVVNKRWLSNDAGKPATTKAANLPDAPNFSLKDLQGSDVSLEQFRGKVVLVNFWATWCGPCEIEMPWFIDFQQKYGARGFTVVGLAMDEEGKSVVAPWVEKKRFDVNGAQLPLNYPILLANDEVAGKFGGLIGLPTSLLISRDGKILKRFIGLVGHDTYVKAIEENL
ncbi:MAG: TlpA family protein disulfide reductase [Acidobacteria bacterium]|nr:TlpA family protein disulfide reductase [Acidobacteriota bacterium]MCL5289001.1 TlpA family protein disulfide reductase [Acidobacteriota bacterium]